MTRFSYLTTAIRLAVPDVTRFLCVIALLCTLFIGAFSPIVSAEPAPTSNASSLLAYCKTKVSGTKNDAGCSAGNLMNYSIYAASYYCTSKADTSTNANDTTKSDCILAQAKKFVDSAVAKKPTSADALSNDLLNVLKSNCGSGKTCKDYTKPSADSDVSSTADGTCAANNGLCGDCSNNSTASGCVDCSNGICDSPLSNPDARCTDDNCDLVAKYLNPSINLFSVAFGLIAIISLIFGGIQYSASQGDPQAVTKAKGRIRNTIVALVAYFFLYSFLQFLVPGGLFN